ncbi:MAG: esterase-like activity of phytase family protein [Alphaproteobacteria bacterium]|nr:esterase-like activity of phytase family protein [Alphaproteobacteria bacterium]
MAFPSRVHPAYLLIGLVCFLVAPIPLAAADYTVTPILLDDENPDRVTFGKLSWRGGVAITGGDGRFGGLSALHISASGDRLLAISDRGNWLTAMLRYRDGALSTVADFRIAPLLDHTGQPVTGRQADSESLARTDDNGFIVSFERRHRLWRYTGTPDPTRSTPTPLRTPEGFQDLPSNGGIEALTRLCDGRLLAIAEKSVARRDTVAAWVQSDTGWQELAYRTTAGLRPTGAATLPNCDVVVSERSFGMLAGLDIRISQISASSIKAGAVLEPEPLASLSDLLTIDNFEGIAARRNAAGDTLIYLISDDNFSAVQRTLLMMFALD